MKVRSSPIDPSASSISRLAFAKRSQFLPSVVSSLFGFRCSKSDMSNSEFLNPSIPMTTTPFIYATDVAHRAKILTGRNGALRRPRTPLKLGIHSRTVADTFSDSRTAQRAVPTSHEIGSSHWCSKAAALLLSVIGLTVFASSGIAQIIVNPGAGSYPTLKGAFDAINAGTHTG